MLQRTQSIWLLLASICSFASLKLPFYYGTDATGKTIHMDGSLFFYIMLLTISIGVISLINIFLYNNRVLQFRLCVLSVLLEAGLIFLYFKEMRSFNGGTLALSSLLQLGTFVFLLLAATGIRKDEKIIRNSNRLR